MVNFFGNAGSGRYWNPATGRYEDQPFTGSSGWPAPTTHPGQGGLFGAGLGGDNSQGGTITNPTTPPSSPYGPTTPQQTNAGHFSFGNLDAAQQTLYEDNPGLAFQKLLDWYGQGNANFGNTTLGRYIAAQQDRLSNAYLTAAAQQAADHAAGLVGSSTGSGGDPTPLTWTRYLETQVPDLARQFGYMTASQRGANPGSYLVRRNLF